VRIVWYAGFAFFPLYFEPIPQKEVIIHMIEAEKPTEDDFNFYGIELVMVMEVLGEVDFYIKYNFFFENTTFKELFVFITFIVNLKAVFYHNILFFSKTNVYHAPNCHNLAFNV